MSNVSDETSLIRHTRSESKGNITKLTETQLSGHSFIIFTVGSVAGVENVIISNTGYTAVVVLKYI